MMLLAAALAQQGAEEVADVAHGAGWILEHAWIFPLIPFLSFLLILGFGKQLKYKGAELGVTALVACFVLALGAGYQWIRYVDDVNAAAGVEHAAAVVTPPAAAPGESAGAAAQSPTTEGTSEGTESDHETEATTTSAEEEHGTSTEEGGEDHGEAHVAIPPVEKTWTWWQSGGMDFDVGILVDGLSVMMLFVVTFISLLVHVYSTDYVNGDIRYTHYFAFLSLFTASMLMLVMSATTVQFITSWELVGLCSFALIGHWWEEKKNSDAAVKAFITNRVGDIGLLVGMIVLFFTAGNGETFNIRAIDTAAASGSVSHTALLVASLCLLAAVMSKSGQFFLHTWLPDAMAGPTPVSALIHAATMVVAGIFMVARLYPVFFNGFSIAGSSINPLALVGGLTVLVGGSLAFVQADIKKVLAYSTVSQLGYMVLALGVGAWTAALFHLFTHAFFKACLFLGSGSVSHACNHSFDMKADMGGLRKYMPKTFWTFLIAAGALSGIPLLSGFWSKDEILAGAGGLGLSDGANGSYHLILLMGLLCAAMTAAYMTRCVYLTFFGEYRGGASLAHLAAEGVVPLDDQDRFDAGDAREMAEDDVAHPAGVPVTPQPVPAHAVAHEVHAQEVAQELAHGGGGHGGHDAHGDGAHGHGGLPHESGPRITVPLIILAAMSFVTMFANIPHYFSIFPESWQLRFEHFVEPVGDYFVPDLAHAEFSPALALISIALAAIGIGLAFRYYFVKVHRLSPLATELPDGLTQRSRLAALGYRILENKFYLDWLYTDVIVAFFKGRLAQASNWFNQNVLDRIVDGTAEVTKSTAGAVYTYVDQATVDGVVNGSGMGASETGGLLRRIQTGRISQYAALLFAGAAILAAVLVFAI